MNICVDHKIHKKLSRPHIYLKSVFNALNLKRNTEKKAIVLLYGIMLLAVE